VRCGLPQSKPLSAIVPRAMASAVNIHDRHQPYNRAAGHVEALAAQLVPTSRTP
jgi:hypothetical protein